MTPTQIRETFNETIDAFRRSYGDTEKANAKLILSALKSHAWLHDQIPQGIFDRALRLAVAS